MADLEAYRLRQLAAHLGRPRSHAEGLPVLRRHAAAGAAAGGGGCRPDAPAAPSAEDAALAGRRWPRSCCPTSRRWPVWCRCQRRRPRRSRTSSSCRCPSERVLAILVFDDREVQNRVVQLGASRFRRRNCGAPPAVLNEQFRGRTLEEVRQDLIDQLSEMRERLNQGMVDTISVAQQVVRRAARGAATWSCVIAGETKLMGFAELSSVEKLRRLFEAFNEKRDILQLLDLSLQRAGRADLHRPGVRLPDAGRLQRGDRALQRRQRRRGRARRHRPARAWPMSG